MNQEKTQGIRMQVLNLKMFSPFFLKDKKKYFETKFTPIMESVGQRQ